MNKNYTSGHCPNCNENINCDEYYQPKYCSGCGQRLDWNLEKEKDNK